MTAGFVSVALEMLTSVAAINANIIFDCIV
jgi:hypothetical protein